MLNFPLNPAVNDTYVSGDRTWKFNGIGWALLAVPGYGTTSNVAEGTNLYHTTARVRSAISATGSLGYNPSTGVLSYTAPTALSAFTNDSGYLTSITGSQVTTALGFTPYAASNPDGFISSSASITGNAATATKLATARTIAGVSFDGTANIAIPFSGLSSKPTTLSGYGITDAVSSSLLGAVNGVATLDSSGLVSASQLPSYVDDVVEYANFAALPATGESGKIYVLASAHTISGITSSQFRWTGSSYAAIVGSPGSTDALTEGSANLYFTNARARAAISATQNLSYNSTTGVLTGPDLSGYLTSSTAASTYQASLGFTPVNKAGDTMTGALTATRMTGSGLSTGWGETSGVNTGAFNAIMGTGNSATWLLSGTSGGTFMYGIQGLDSGGGLPVLRFYEGSNYFQFSVNTLTANTFSGALSGNASTASALQTARTINGVSFNGTSNITVADATKLPLSGGTMTGAIAFAAGQTWPTFNQSTSGSAATLTTGRTIAMTGDVSYTSGSFDGSANVTGTATLAASGVTAGTYTKVTVDAKGRATSGTSLSSGDVTTALGFTPLSNAGGTVFGALALSGGTANGLAYLNGSKVLTTGSALTFDGTNLRTSNGPLGSSYGVYLAGSSIAGVGALGSIGVYDDNTLNEAIQITDQAKATVFKVGTGTNGTTAEQMRLTSTGLGIGTSSPSYKLDVRGVAAAGNGTITSALSYDSGGLVGTLSNHSFGVMTNSNVVARFDTSGNLGLGVTPSAWASGARSFDLYGGGSLYANASSNDLRLGCNVFINAVGGGNTYKTSNPASFYYQASGAHLWYTAPSGTAGNAISFTQAMTLDASGYLLVGATSSLGAGASRFQLGSAASATSGHLIKSTNSAVGLYASSTSSSYMTWGAGTFMAFGEAPDNLGSFTERARIDSSGNLLVGNTSRASSERLSVWSTGANDVIFADTAGGGTGYVYRTNTSSGLAGYFITSAGQAGMISCSGTTTSYNSGSDYRLKDNVRPLAGALETVAKLKPVAFEWKHDGSYGDSFLAHELAEVCPQAVVGKKDAVDAEGKPVYQSIDTSFLVATLTAAIQEQQAIITALTARVAQLESN